MCLRIENILAVFYSVKPSCNIMEQYLGYKAQAMVKLGNEWHKSLNFIFGNEMGRVLCIGEANS